MVNIGLGFHVQLTLDEAVRFIVDKEEHLQLSAHTTCTTPHCTVRPSPATSAALTATLLGVRWCRLAKTLSRRAAVISSHTKMVTRSLTHSLCPNCGSLSPLLTMALPPLRCVCVVQVYEGIAELMKLQPKQKAKR